MTSPEIRFWTKVDVRSAAECWPWVSALDERGYGRFSLAGSNTKATHFALLMDGRPRPCAHSVARHKCDNPGCVNPAHLEWGSQLDNIADTKKRRRNRNGGLRGVDHGNAKLTDKQVRAIRQSNRLHREIAAEYQISKSLVSLLKRGVGWEHVL